MRLQRLSGIGLISRQANWQGAALPVQLAEMHDRRLVDRQGRDPLLAGRKFLLESHRVGMPDLDKWILGRTQQSLPIGTVDQLQDGSLVSVDGIEQRVCPRPSILADLPDPDAVINATRCQSCSIR